MESYKEYNERLFYTIHCYFESILPKKTAQTQPPVLATNNSKAAVDTDGRVVLADSDSDSSSDDDDELAVAVASGSGINEDIQQVADTVAAILEFQKISKYYEIHCAEELTDPALYSLYPKELNDL